MSASTSVSSIIVYKPFDKPDELEQEWQTHYLFLTERCQDQSDEQINQILQTLSTSSPQIHLNLTKALIFGVLVDQNSAPKFLQYLQLLTHDQFLLCVDQLRDLVYQKYSRLKKSVTEQIIWLFNALLDFNASNLDVLSINILRYITAGDIQSHTIWLIEQMLKIFSNKTWLYEQTQLIPFVVYTFLTVIPTHSPQFLDSIRQKEVALCVELLRQKWKICQVIGRDLVRLVYDVSRIKEINLLWKEVFLNPPQAGSPPPIRILCSTPTPKQFFTSRIMPEMEHWLTWLLKNVPFGSQRRYQIWFANKYFSQQANGPLILDLVRWVCGANHPSKSVIKSDVVPRWAILCWLITSFKTSYWIQFARQCIFYDWIFYVPNKDNIMNLEPGLLMIINSLNKYTELSVSLTEYLVHLSDTYLIDCYPQMLEDIKLNLGKCLRTLLQYKVVSSLDVLFNCSTLNPTTRAKLRKIFDKPQTALPYVKEAGENEESRNAEARKIPATIDESNLKHKITKKTNIAEQAIKTTSNIVQKANEIQIKPNSNEISFLSQKGKSEISEPQKNSSELKNFSSEIKIDGPDRNLVTVKPNSNNALNFTADSDNEDDINFSLKWKEAVSNSDISVSTETEYDKEFFALDKNFFSAYKSFLSRFNQTKNIDVLDELLKYYEVNMTDTNDPAIFKIASCLVEALSEELIRPLKLSNVLDHSFCKLFEWYCCHFDKFNSVDLENYTRDENSNKKLNTDCVFELMVNLFLVENSTGYRLMSYLVAKYSHFSDESNTVFSVEIDKANLIKYLQNIKTDVKYHMGPYIHFLSLKLRKKQLELSKHKDAMLQDAKLLAENDLEFFNELAPYWFQALENFSVNYEALIQLIVNYCLPASILNISSHLILNKYRIVGFKAKQLLISSLQWDSISQNSFWTIINAEFSHNPEFLISQLDGFLSKIDFVTHVECLIGLQNFLTSLAPSKSSLKLILLAPLSLNEWVETVMSCWLGHYPEILYTSLTQALDLISNQINSINNTKIALTQLIIWRHRFYQVTIRVFEQADFVEKINLLKNKEGLQDLCSLLLKTVLVEAQKTLASSSLVRLVFDSINAKQFLKRLWNRLCEL